VAAGLECDPSKSGKPAKTFLYIHPHRSHSVDTLLALSHQATHSDGGIMHVAVKGRSHNFSVFVKVRGLSQHYRAGKLVTLSIETILALNV
jgi:hypothetical protein